MSEKKMHEGEVDIDADLVRRLLADQFPHWESLPLVRFESSGTVNAIYRLGEDMYVRLPLVESWAWHLKVEAKWLPQMRPNVSVEVPEVLGVGVPAEGYPFQWAVYRWIEGDTWTADGVRDEREGALDLANFLRELERVDAAGVEPLDAKFEVPLLASLDEWIRTSIEQARDMIDADSLTHVGPMKLRVLGECLLRPAPLLAKCPHTLAKRF